MNTYPARRSHGAGHIVLIVFGALALLIALGVVIGGSVLLWADRTQRDAQGYLNTRIEPVDAAGYAVVAPRLDVDIPGWASGGLGTVRVDVTPRQAGGDVFVGIGPRSSVEAYLGGVQRDQVFRFNDSSGVGLDHLAGGAPATPPGEQTFWAASRSGAGTQTLTWQVAGGSWELVVMRPDAARGLAFDASAGATVPFILPLGIGLLSGGVLLGVVGLLMVLLGARPGRSMPAGYGYPPAVPGWAPAPPGGAGSGGSGWAPPPPLPPGAAAFAGPPPDGPRFTVYPVALEGHLDEPQSRWLWLVKWLLIIPHMIVLGLLMIPFTLLTLAAAVAILFTGRYPRSIFDFNLGVMQWWWRVSFYSYGALGTDRYPPFSLGPEPAYPARLDVAYPERLSRGLVLVKSWLLAIPHLLVVGVFAGGFMWHWWGGAIGVLALVAGIILLVDGRHNRSVFDVLMALNRWVFRVLAYVALMRDEYPPFRFDLGEIEPEVTGTAPAAPPMAPRPLGT